MHSPASCFDEHFLHLFSFIHRLSNLVFTFCAGYKKCVLIGHDWGGLIAWCFAIYYPEMLNRVIILNCPHPAVFSGECHFKPLDTSYLMITDWRPWGLAELMDFSSESQAKSIWFNFLSLLSRLSPPSPHVRTGGAQQLAAASILRGLKMIPDGREHKNDHVFFKY